MCLLLFHDQIKFSCFKQSPLNFTLAIEPTQFTEGLNILLDVEVGLKLSSDNHLDFHEKILLSLILTVLNINMPSEILNNFE